MKNYHVLFYIVIGVVLMQLVNCSAYENQTNTASIDTPNWLFEPVRLNPDTTTIILVDFLPNPEVLDSVSVHPALKKNILPLNGSIQLIVQDAQKLPAISALTFYLKNKTSHSVVLKKSDKMPFVYQFAQPSQGKPYQKVQLAGSINNWNPNETTLTLNTAGFWQVLLFLTPGNYQYKIVADEKWMLDPANPDSIDNNVGGYNSVLRITAPPTQIPKPVLYTLKSSKKDNKNEVLIGGLHHPDNWLALWENNIIPVEKLTDADSLFRIQIPDNNEISKKQRSYLRIYASNNAGAANDLLIPLEKGQPITQTKQLARTDKHAQIMYFALIDRFNNGNTANDAPLKDKRVLPAANYQGGDLAGIEQKLQQGWFDSLGVNTLWLSPIIQNPPDAWQEYIAPQRFYSGYHGYWPVNLKAVDPHFGTPAELKKLVSTAHTHNSNILTDWVANHLHQTHPLVKQHPNWFNPLILPDGTKNIRIWDAQRLTTWFDTFLPDIDYANPEVVTAMTDSATWWITTYNLDGFRHDATKHINNNFWRALTQKLRQTKQYPDLYQIGETFGSRELIGSYVGTGQMDAQFDFNLYFDARAVFALPPEKVERLTASLLESLNYYGSHSVMGNISGNHDMARFISYASGGLRFDEDAKQAAWRTTPISVKDTLGYYRLAQLQAFNLTIPGVPVIYYGDEIGLPGADDPDNRRFMPWTNYNKRQQYLLQQTRKLGQLRRSSMPLLYGDLTILHDRDGLLVYMRHYFDQWDIVVINKNTEQQSFVVNIPNYLPPHKGKTNFATPIQQIERQIRIEIPAHGFEIISSGKSPDK